MTYFDIQGKALVFNEWAKKLVDDDYALVELTRIRSWYSEFAPIIDCDVSTRWTGLNMGQCDGPLKIFETLLFCEGPGLPGKILVDRYSTREASRRGHARTVYNLFADRFPSEELPEGFEPTCPTCTTAPIRKQLIQGQWTCEVCRRALDEGHLTYPVAKLKVPICPNA